MPYINGTDRNQLSFLPMSLEDHVAPESDVRVLDAFVEGIGLEQLGFTRTGSTPVEGAGAPTYSAGALLRVMLYGFYYHLPSSRKLEWLCRTNVEVQWLTGNLRPTHATINTFAGENGAAIQGLFRRFVDFLKAAALVDGEVIALDGTKIKGNAARDMASVASTTKAISRYEKQIQYFLEVLRDDDHDDHPDGMLQRVSTLGGVQAIEARIGALKEHRDEARALQAQVVASGQKYLSPSDPEARMMRTRQGKVPGYNYQLAVDGKHGFIVDAALVQDQNDLEQLAPRVASIREQMGDVKYIVADSGYHNARHLVQVNEHLAQGHSPSGHGSAAPTVYVYPRRARGTTKNFVYDAGRDVYRCPDGRDMPLYTRNKSHHGSLYHVYQSISCDGCQIRAACTKPTTRRTIMRHVNADLLQRVRERVESQEAKQYLAKRKEIVEHVCGSVKAHIGPAFRTRGPTRTATEATMASITHNLKRFISVCKMNVDAMFETMKSLQPMTM